MANSNVATEPRTGRPGRGQNEPAADEPFRNSRMSAAHSARNPANSRAARRTLPGLGECSGQWKTAQPDFVRVAWNSVPERTAQKRQQALTKVGSVLETGARAVDTRYIART